MNHRGVINLFIADAEQARRVLDLMELADRDDGQPMIAADAAKGRQC